MKRKSTRKLWEKEKEKVEENEQGTCEENYEERERKKNYQIWEKWTDEENWRKQDDKSKKKFRKKLRKTKTIK